MTVEEVLAALSDAEVRFVVVGGVAVVLHSHPRLTADLDLVIDLEVGPAERAITVLTDLGLRPRLPVPASAFADPETRDRWVTERDLTFFTLTDPVGMLEVDLFARAPLLFEALWADAGAVQVGQTVVRVAAIDDLIAMKRAAGRPQDVADIAALEALGSTTPFRDIDDGGIPSDLGFEASRAAQIAHWAATTPDQRLAWLTVAQRFAHRAGALPRCRWPARTARWRPTDPR